MRIDRDEARRIAELARLDFDEAGLDAIAGDMTRILDYVEQIKSFSSPGGPPAIAADAIALRSDEVRPGTGRDDVERNAPEWRDGFFVVPPVIE